MTSAPPPSFWAEAAKRVQGEDAATSAAEEGSARKRLRREAAPLPPAVAPTDDPLRLRLSEELDYARRMLEQMGDELSGDQRVIMSHMTALQSVDIVGQIIGHVADVVRSSDPSAAVDRIGMAELKARLKRHSIG